MGIADSRQPLCRKGCKENWSGWKGIEPQSPQYHELNKICIFMGLWQRYLKRYLSNVSVLESR